MHRYPPTGDAIGRIVADDFLAPYERLGVVGSSNRRKLTHHLTGLHKETGFEFLQADLTWHRGGENSSTSPVFHGLQFKILVPVRVPIRSRIALNFGTISRKIAKIFPGAAVVSRGVV